MRWNASKLCAYRLSWNLPKELFFFNKVNEILLLILYELPHGIMDSKHWSTVLSTNKSTSSDASSKVAYINPIWFITIKTNYKQIWHFLGQEIVRIWEYVVTSCWNVWHRSQISSNKCWLVIVKSCRQVFFLHFARGHPLSWNIRPEADLSFWFVYADSANHWNSRKSLSGSEYYSLSPALMFYFWLAMTF